VSTRRHADGAGYSGALTVSGRPGAPGTSLVGQASGAFFAGAGDPVRETGGHFGVSPRPGSNILYSAAGIFVGKKQ
jgi:hypothetical protein